MFINNYSSGHRTPKFLAAKRRKAAEPQPNAIKLTSIRILNTKYAKATRSSIVRAKRKKTANPPEFEQNYANQRQLSDKKNQTME